MQALRPRVEALADGLLNRMAEMSPPVDLHEVLSFSPPVLVICELLGVSGDDRNCFPLLRLVNSLQELGRPRSADGWS